MILMTILILIIIIITTTTTTTIATTTTIVEYRDECINMIHKKDFFLNLPPMIGGVEALLAMESRGFKVFLCTAPLLESVYCAQEKLAWVRQHLGEMWVPKTM